MLATVLLLTALAGILALCITPLVRMLGIHWNLIDRPDGQRKVHTKPIPRIGGVAIALAYCGAVLVIALLSSTGWVASSVSFIAVKSVAPAAALVFLTGLTDDIFNLKPWHKFGMQFIAAVLAVASGVHIHGVAAFAIHPLLGAVGSVVWLVACTNAVNLIDGLDGLAVGISLLATVTALLASLMSGNIGLTIATAPLAGALLGFLVFNFNPASIFLGDSGSLFLGFLLGCYSIIWSGTAVTALEMAAPLLALAVPLLDTSLAVARRFLRCQPIFKADRAHIHHRLLARGLSHKRTVLVLYLVAALAGSLALCLIWARGASFVLAIFASATFFGIRQLGYAEFQALHSVLFGGGIRRQISAYLIVKTLEKGLADARSASECWAAVQLGCKELGFHTVSMQLAGDAFYCEGVADPSGAWALRVSMSASDWVEFSPNSWLLRHPGVIVPFANAVRTGLAAKRIDTSPELVPVESIAGLYSTAASAAN